MLALVIPANADSVVAGVEQSSDLRGLRAFESASALLTQLNRQGFPVERLVIVASGVSSALELQSLSSYFTNRGVQLPVVLLVRSWDEHDMTVLSWYREAFPFVVCTDYTLSQSDAVGVDVFVRLFSESIDTIRLQHSHSGGSNASVSVREASADPVAEEPLEVALPQSRAGASGVIRSFSVKKTLFGKVKVSKADKQAINVLYQQANAFTEG